MFASTWGRLCGALLFVSLIAVPIVPARAQSIVYGQTDPNAPVYPFMPDADRLSPAPRRQVVSYPTAQPPGTIIIDTTNAFLYLTLGAGKAMRYGVGVGRPGFEWSGVETITRKAEWPNWTPPAAMVARQPYLPRWIGGGPGNPLGARALYLGHTDYRIHGTNEPSSIGRHMSSGCIRLLNRDVIDLYNRVGIGTKVIVLPDARPPQISNAVPAAAAVPPAQQAVSPPLARTASRNDGTLTGIY